MWREDQPRSLLSLLFTLNLTCRTLATDSCPDRWPARHRVPEAGQCKSHQDLFDKTQVSQGRKRENEFMYQRVLTKCPRLTFSLIKPHNYPGIYFQRFLPLSTWGKWGLRKMNLFAKREIESGLWSWSSQRRVFFYSSIRDLLSLAVEPYPGMKEHRELHTWVLPSSGSTSTIPWDAKGVMWLRLNLIHSGHTFLRLLTPTWKTNLAFASSLHDLS